MVDQNREQQVEQEAIKTEVLKELEEARKQGSMTSYLNNLRYNLNWALSAEFTDDFIITSEKSSGRWTRPRNLDEIGSPELHSQRWQGESPEQTLTALRNTLKELQVSKEILTQTSMPNIQVIMEMSDDEIQAGQAKIEAFYENTLVPIYIKLRQMGYSHYDLVG